MRTKSPVKTPSAYRRAEKNGFGMLCELINDAHNRLRRYSLELTSLQGALQAQLSPEHFAMLEEEIASQVARTHNRRRKEHSSKFLDF